MCNKEKQFTTHPRIERPVPVPPPRGAVGVPRRQAEPRRVRGPEPAAAAAAAAAPHAANGVEDRGPVVARGLARRLYDLLPRLHLAEGVLVKLHAQTSGLFEI
jgi:hypothetical protein